LKNIWNWKNQLHWEVEAELGRVKDVVNPTFRIFVNGIGISVSLDIIKVILILFNFNFLNLIFVLFRKSFHFFARSSMWKKFFLATSSLTQSYLPCSLTFCNPFRYTLLHANMKPAPSKKSKAGSLQPHPWRLEKKLYFSLSEKRSFSNPRQDNATYK